MAESGGPPDSSCLGAQKRVSVPVFGKEERDGICHPFPTIAVMLTVREQTHLQSHRRFAVATCAATL